MCSGKSWLELINNVKAMSEEEYIKLITEIYREEELLEAEEKDLGNG